MGIKETKSGSANPAPLHNTGGSIIWGHSIIYADNLDDPKYKAELAKEFNRLLKLIRKSPNKKVYLD